MKLSHFLDVTIPDATALVGGKDMTAIKTKALAMIGDQEIFDEDGVPIDVETIVLVPAGASKNEDEELDENGNPKKADGDEELDENGNPKKAEDDEDVVNAAAAKVAVIIGGQLKSFTTEIGKAAKTLKALNISGGGKRNDEPVTFGFKNFGEQLAAIAKHYQSNGREDDKRLHTKAPAGMNVSIPSEGGFLLAPEFSDRIMMIVHQDTPLIDRTDVIDINGPSIKINAIDETSRATGSRLGGVRGYWVAEAEAMTASKAKFRQIELTPQKLAVLAYATEELLMDGGAALQQIIERGAADEIKFLTGDAIFNGSGAGKPLGILNANCLVTEAKETSQAAATIVTENVIKMWSRLHVSARSNAVWFINQDTEPQLHTMSLAVGTGGQIVYMPPGGLSSSPYATLLGRPVVATEFNATLGTVGDILLADMKQYLSATRGAIKAASSMHVKFLTDEMAFRFTFMVDGEPWWNSALTPKNGTATQSPFVALAARS